MTVIAGTGVSIETTGDTRCASWKGLIADGIDYAVGRESMDEATAQDLRSELTSDQFAEWPRVAEQLSQALQRSGDFRSWLQASVGTLQPKNRTLVDAIHALGAPLATTNYDTLLLGGRFDLPIPWTDREQVAEWLRGERPRGILHLHGYFERPESIVFGDRSYERLLNDGHAQSVERVLAQTRILLFIGCGDGLFDPNFGALLDWISAVLPETRHKHFCLCRSADKATLQSRLRTNRLAYISYGDTFGELAGFIRTELLSPSRRRRAEAARSLPVLSHCIGRASEVDAVVAALLDTAPRRLPIVGPPGMGKSTVAARALHDARVAARFRERRWFVRCESAENRTALVGLLAASLEVTREPGVEGAVLEMLAAQTGALVLDGLETALRLDSEAVENLLGELAMMDSLTLIVTIRGATRPTSITWDPTVDMTPLHHEDAKEAFIAISGKAHFASDPYLDELVGALDGLPLAIVLMARYAQSYRTLELVWREWQAKRTRILENLARSFELSIAPLSRAAKRLLAIIAMLPNGTAQTDVSAVFAGGERSAHELRNAALVFDEADRVRILSPIREYLVNEGRQPARRDALAAIGYYVGLAAAETEKIGGVAGAEAIRRLAPEVVTIESVLTHKLTPIDDRVMSAALGWTTLIRFTGLGTPAAVEHVINRAIAAGMKEAAARCIHGLGDVAVARSDFRTAWSLYERARQLFADVASDEGMAACEQGFGAVSSRQKKFEVARKYFENALAVFERLGDQRRAAICIQSLAEASHRLRDYVEAQRMYEAAYKLFVDIGSPGGQASCLKSLGNVALVSDLERAASLFQAARELYDTVGNIRGRAKCIKGFGHIALERNDYAAARAAYDEALPMYQQVGSILGQAICKQGLAETEFRQAHYRPARRLFYEALSLYHQLEDRQDSIEMCEAKLGEISRLAPDVA